MGDVDKTGKDKEKRLIQRLRRMLITARKKGYSVDEAIRAVRAERLLEQGAYDQEHWDVMDEFFIRKRGMRKDRREKENEGQ